MSSLERMLGLLDVFTPAAPVWSADDLIRYSGSSRSTTYRYVKALLRAGLLTPVANGYYMLGPRILEFDRQIRQCDPLYNAGGPIIKELVARTGHSALLCALFSDSVMCVRDERSPDSSDLLITRGQKRPLFMGAPSKVILPYLSPHQLRGLFSKHRKTIASAGLGSDWDSFRKTLRAIRRDGYAATVGEFNPGVAGIAAPIFNRSGNILGSLAIAFSQAILKPEEVPVLARDIIAAADQVTAQIRSLNFQMDRPARAVG